MMPRLFALFCAAGLLCLAAPAAAADFLFATPAHGARLLGARDGFFEAMHSNEIRLRAAQSGEMSREALRRQFREGALAWNAEERAAIEASLARLHPLLGPSHPLLPREIVLVKISPAVEDGLPHTRLNAIFLPAQAAALPAETLDFVMAHEIFHVLLRRQASRRDSLYALIGFRPCRFRLPEALRARRIVNPDAPEDRHYVALPGDQGSYVPLLLARPNVETAPPALGESLQAQLLRVEVVDGVCRLRRDQAGNNVLVGASALPGLFEAIGRNSTYVSHPEELLADNYAYLLTRRAEAPNRALLDRLEAWLASQR